MFYAERFEVVTKVAERIERVDECEAEGEYEAEERGDDESHNLVVGEARREEADGDERCAEEEQPEVGAPGAAHVDVAHRIAYPIDCYDIDEGRQQRDNQQGEAGEELRPHNLHVGERQGEQEVHRAGTLFFRERAHGDSWYKEEEQEL